METAIAPNVTQQKPLSTDAATINLNDFKWNLGAWKAAGYHYSLSQGIIIDASTDKAKIAKQLVAEVVKQFPALPGQADTMTHYRQGFIIGVTSSLERFVKSSYPPNGITTPELSILGERQRIPGLSLHTIKVGSTIQLTLKDEFTKEKKVYRTITCKEADLDKGFAQLFSAIESYNTEFEGRNNKFLDSIPKALQGTYSVGVTASQTLINGVERVLLQNIGKTSLIDIVVSMKPRGPADITTEENSFILNKDYLSRSPMKGVECNGEVTELLFTIPKSSLKNAKAPSPNNPTKTSDRFGNQFIIASMPEHPDHYAVSIVPPPSSTPAGQYQSLNIDFSPIGRPGESVRFFNHRPPTALSSRGGVTISSALGEASLKAFTPIKQDAVFQSINKIEKLFGYKSGELAKNIRVEKAHDAAAYASSMYPNTIFIDDDTLKASPASLTLTGLHEAAHLVDLASGWKMSASLTALFDRITKTDKKFFECINKECFVLNANLKDHEGADHSADNPKELLASLIVSITALDDTKWKAACKDFDDRKFYKTYRECLETIKKSLLETPSPFPQGIVPTEMLKNLNSKIAVLSQLEKA